ncbi:MAG TPA: hypothetical protein VLG11_02725 [Candidatus Saccharimonadales bacterium]|nr:hypothetical protein [Candidatus Saccharimonadales bacterium]
MSNPERLSLLTVPLEYLPQPKHNMAFAPDLAVCAIAGVRFQFDRTKLAADWLVHRHFDRMSRTLRPYPLPDLPEKVAERFVGFFNNRFVDPDSAVGMQHDDLSFVRYVTGSEPETVTSHFPTHKYNFGENVGAGELRAGGAYALRPLIEEIEEPPITFVAVDADRVVTTYGFGRPLLLTTAEGLLAFHPSQGVVPLIAKPAAA